MTTHPLDTFAVLDPEVRGQKMAEAAHSGLHLYNQWTVLDPALKQRVFNAAFPGALNQWSALDPALEVKKMNTALGLS